MRNIKFPKTEPGNRSFQLKWLDRYDWIEYSISRDAVFCNTCRQFGKTSNDPAFTSTGYNNWQSALTENRGFSRHQKSTDHANAAIRKDEKAMRILSGKSVSELVNNTVLTKRRYYCSTIVDIIIFLTSNRLALRGDWNDEDKEEYGLFNSLFEFALKRDKELADCQKYMPPNVTYKSPIIQNELIEILAETVRDEIVKEIKSSDADTFTILFDGTKDKNGNECISLAARFVANGKPKEALLFFETSEDLDAKAFTQLTLGSLNNYGLDANKILSQCYDGAPVMSGYKSGVAKQLQDELHKIIPYVHCFNHRLHLVIVHTVNQIRSVRQFFEHLQTLYNFFKKPKVKKLYDGKSVEKLIDTRWAGHLKATKAVRANYTEISSALDKAKDANSKLDGEDIAMAIGLSKVIKQKEFVFLLAFMSDFLDSLGPVDRLLQSRSISFNRAMPMIQAIQSTISDWKSDENFNKYMKIAGELCPISLEPTQTRKRRRSTTLDEFVVGSTIGQRSKEDDDVKAMYYEIIQVVDRELKERFSENNDILLALTNADNMDLNMEDLKQLETLGLKIPADHELLTAKRYIKKRK